MTMRLLLDSANVSEIKEMSRSSVIAGVTTNPSLIAKEKNDGRPYTDVLREIWDTISYRGFHFSCEVITLDPESMLTQALDLHRSLTQGGLRADQVYIKIPVAPETMPIITQLRNVDIPVNATGCMTAMQAKLASDAGAHVVSFFYARMKDYIRFAKVPPLCSASETEVVVVEMAQQEISTYRSWFNSQNASAQIIAGSIRNTDDVLQCWSAGAHYVTTSKKVIAECLEHPKTRESITGFQKDIDAWLA
jgi:transaldolase